MVLDPRNLIVLAYRHRLYRVDRNCKIVGAVSDANNIKYISQGLEIDVKSGKYKTIFGVDNRGSWIGMVKGWYNIGEGIIIDHWGTDGLIGVYDKTNFKHLQRMLWDAHKANDTHTHYDD